MEGLSDIRTLTLDYFSNILVSTAHIHYYFSYSLITFKNVKSNDSF
jgi:hypothetical protein